MVRLERGFVTGLSCAASACARARGCCACTHGLTPLAVYIYILLIVRVQRVASRGTYSVYSCTRRCEADERELFD